MIQRLEWTSQGSPVIVQDCSYKLMRTILLQMWHRSPSYQ